MAAPRVKRVAAVVAKGVAGASMGFGGVASVEGGVRSRALVYPVLNICQ